MQYFFFRYSFFWYIGSMAIRNQIIQAEFDPLPNDQREDQKWEWDGVRIPGNSQCMGNGFEDVMNSIAMETGLRTFAPGSTYNYYATFFGTFKDIFKRTPPESHFFDTSFHCSVVNRIAERNGIPHRTRRHSTRDLDLAFRIMDETRRIILLSINSAVGRHIIRVRRVDKPNGLADSNDPFGKNPYKVIRQGGFVTYTIQEIRQMGINSVVWIEPDGKRIKV
jgi:hypothetical protein